MFSNWYCTTQTRFTNPCHRSKHSKTNFLSVFTSSATVICHFTITFQWMDGWMDATYQHMTKWKRRMTRSSPSPLPLTLQLWAGTNRSVPPNCSPPVVIHNLNTLTYSHLPSSKTTWQNCSIIYNDCLWPLRFRHSQTCSPKPVFFKLISSALHAVSVGYFSPMTAYYLCMTGHYLHRGAG